MVCINDLALLSLSAPRHVSLTPSDARVMVIGDVHGCFDELQELIHRFGSADDVVCASLILCLNLHPNPNPIPKPNPTLA